MEKFTTIIKPLFNPVNGPLRGFYRHRDGDPLRNNASRSSAGVIKRRTVYEDPDGDYGAGYRRRRDPYRRIDQGTAPGGT